MFGQYYWRYHYHVRVYVIKLSKKKKSIIYAIFQGVPNFCIQISLQEFADADAFDAMPSITLENNVIHNNEGYGVIMVKPNNEEQHRVSQNRSDGM